MAAVPRMTHEAWPAWTKGVFVLGSVILVVLGVLSMLMSKHQGGGFLGLACLIVGVLYLFGLIVKPRWLDDPR